MNKILFTVIASLTCFTSLQAIPSNLGSSFREYQSILDASELIQTVIPQAETIIDIKRTTKDLDAAVVYYEVKTLKSEKKQKKATYLLEVEIKPNQLLGPVEVTVLSIKSIKN